MSSPPPAAHKAADPLPPAQPIGRVLGAAGVVTVAVTLVSIAGRLVPKPYSGYAATAIGLVFLGATWFLTIRPDDSDARAWGLSLGGLLDRERIDPRRLARDAGTALLWTLALAIVFFPPFYFGARELWHPRHPFSWGAAAPTSPLDDVAGQLFVIALPEEAFFRGYLQSALNRVWAPRWRVLGAPLGAGWLVSAAIFAVGHVLTSPHPSRLAVFFPALVFGFLRARTGGIGAGVVFHAACNLYSATLARGFGLPT
jgi:membrane protease YdiL (CAAX protease family)